MDLIEEALAFEQSKISLKTTNERIIASKKVK